MTLAVLIPYRPDNEQRELIRATTERLWWDRGYEPIYCDDGLDGPLFSFSRAVNRARKLTDADCLLVYNVDALPLPAEAVEHIHARLAYGTPWSVLFEGQQRFTEAQTERILAGDLDVGPAAGQICPGREALYGIRADVFDALRGMDERFVGWGHEDFAFHLVLKTAYPHGHDEPPFGLFQSLHHEDAPRTALIDNQALWNEYRKYAEFGPKLVTWYMGRP